MPGGSGLFAARQLASQPVDFLALLAAHVLLRYEVTKRTYGALSTTFRKRVGWVAAPPVREPPREAFAPLPPAPPAAQAAGQHSLQLPASPIAPQDDETDFTKKRRRNWARLIAKVWKDDPALCSSCGKEMKIIAAITSPAQDDVIEKVLRHMRIWNPPWKLERRARGPPSREHGAEKSPEGDPSPTEPIDPERSFEDYAVDPPSLEVP